MAIVWDTRSDWCNSSGGNSQDSFLKHNRHRGEFRCTTSKLEVPEKPEPEGPGRSAGSWSTGSTSTGINTGQILPNLKMVPMENQ